MLGTIALRSLSLRQIAALVGVAILTLIALILAYNTYSRPLVLPLGIRIGHEGHLAKIGRLEAEADDWRRAAAMAEFIAALRKAQTERAYRTIAQETDDNVDQSLDAERASVERFIAAGGVRQAGCPGTAFAAPGDPSARERQAVYPAPQLDGADHVRGWQSDAATGPLQTIVTVYGDDVRICTVNTVLAEQWRNQLLRLEADSEAAQ